MTTFDERDKGFENKFAHDEELMFKANARRNKLTGLWAAGKMGKAGPQAEQYAKETVAAEVDGSIDIVDKLLQDFNKAGVSVSAKEIREEMDRLMLVAKQQITGEGK